MSLAPPEVMSRAAQIKLVVLDVDGVLTDGSLNYGSEAESFKRYHVRDGMGIRLLRHFGYHVAVISARPSKLVQKRMEDLRIEHWVVGHDDKRTQLAALLSKLQLSAQQVAYLGDDLLDVPVMQQVGLAVAVADAHPFTKAHAHWITSALGGNGAVRELSDLVLDASLGLNEAYRAFLDVAAQPKER